MEYNENNENNGKKPETPISWQKDDVSEKKSFDFDAFLEDDLEARITSALDGRDLMEPDAFGESVPEYRPRAAAEDAEHGKHEAPEPVSTAQRPPESTESREERPVLSDPRYAAPERPRVVVAEPRPEVYVEAPRTDAFEPKKAAERKKTGNGLKWAAGILAAIAVLGLFFIIRVTRESGENPGSTPRPTSQTAQPQEKPDAAPTPAPEETPRSVPTHRINVTAGSGGSISPSGSVSVEDGKDAAFTIVPDPGHVLSQLIIDGESVGITDRFSFTNVTTDHTIYAVFTAASTPTAPPTPTPTPEPTPEPTPVPTPEPTPEPTPPNLRIRRTRSTSRKRFSPKRKTQAIEHEISPGRCGRGILLILFVICRASLPGGKNTFSVQWLRTRTISRQTDRCR